MAKKSPAIVDRNSSGAFGSFFRKFRFEIFFLSAMYLLGLYLTLLPRLKTDPHLLTFNADIWYRLAITQYFYDHWHLSQFSIRYLPFAHVPEWYPPLYPCFLAILAKIFMVDLPTVCSRIMPFFESLTPLSLFLLARYIYGRRIAALSTLALCLTTCFVYWNSISSPQSFISFMIPLVILAWVWYVNNLDNIRRKQIFILAFGIVLGFCFLVHLMYLLMIIILIFVHLSLILEKKAAVKTTIDLISAILVSQLVTIWWWLPDNLYWWWTNGLVTSSSSLIAFSQLYKMYGPAAFFMGCVSFLFIVFNAFIAKKKISYLWLPVFWAIIPLIETQNEAILTFIHRRELSWSPVFKPLEGFRFQPYLAQPFALCIGISITLVMEKLKRLTRMDFYVIGAILLGVLLLYDIKVVAQLDGKLRNAGITLNEYRAALWFRNNSEPEDLMAADYYRSQLITGVCGGRAIDSLAFPLRNTDVKYIGVRESFKTGGDIYTIYSTRSAEAAYKLMQKYGLTHVFISSTMDKTSRFIGKLPRGYGADIYREKFKDTKFFDIIYNTDGVMIIKRKF